MKDFNVWVWNSWNSFTAIPTALFKAAGFIVLGVALLAGLLAIGAGALVGTVISDLLFDMRYEKQSPRHPPSAIKYGVGAFIGAIIAAIPVVTFLALLAAAIFIAGVAIQLTLGLAGIVVGLVTSPGLLFIDSHSYWLADKEGHIEEMQETKNMVTQAIINITNFVNTTEPTAEDAYTATCPEVARVSYLANTYGRLLFSLSCSPDDLMIDKIREFDDDYFNAFWDFDPNDPAWESNHLLQTYSNTEIVKTSSGKYVASRFVDKEGYEPGYGYLNNETVQIVPAKLRRKFYGEKPHIDIITLQKLPLLVEADVPQKEESSPPDASGNKELRLLPVVRTIYGDYFDKETLAKILQQKHECPISKRYLTMELVKDVTLKAAAPAPTQTHNNSNDHGSSQHNPSSRSVRVVAREIR